MKSVKHRAFLLATIFPLILLLGNNADAHDNKKVHPYIATAAKAVWPPQGTVAYEEMSNYLGPLTYYDGDCDSAHSGESITEGAFEEDIYNSLADLCSNDWPWGRSFTTHFYDCDKPEPMNGLDLYEPSYGALWQAQAYMNYAKYYYTKDKPDKPLAYWYLGKIAHLLADVSVPAHVHNDPHGGPPEELLGGFDSYEKYMAENYSKWNHTHAGSIDEIPAHSTLDDIFYNLGQITQYFPSDNADGNGKNLDDSIEEKLEDLNGCQYFDVDETNSKLSEMKIHDDDLETIGNYLMPRAIKYTAALYRLFWQEVHPVNPTIAQTPMEGPMGTSCRQWGTGFTPNSQGKFYFQLGDGSGDYDWFWQPMDGDGHFDIPYVFNKPPGQYKWYVEDVTGEKSNEVTYTITGSTDASTPSAYPSSGTWTSTPINISVSCGNADRIYCKVTTAFGSMPEDPPTPTIESHDIFDTGVEYIGSSGTFKLWGQTGQIKYIKVRFRGYNNSSGYGPTTGVYQYAIDLRDWDPGDDGTTEGPDGNVKKVEIDATGNNWHHSYNAYPGMSLESRVTVTNKGDEIIDYFEVTIYRSDDLNFNPDLDYSYGREEEEEDLYPGDKDHKHRTITAPSTPGKYYIFAHVNRVDGEFGGSDTDPSNDISRNDDVEEYAELTVYPWPPPDWSIVKEENDSKIYIFYNNKKWWALSWEILSALDFRGEDLIVYPDGKLSSYASGPNVLSDGIFGQLNSCIYLFESGKWHYLADWAYMDCKGGQHPENVIPITPALLNMYGVGADVVPCLPEEERQALIALYDSTNGPNWTNHTGWKSDSYPDTWYGVTLENGRVIALNLSSNGLSGSIPPEIGNLTSLQTLNLSWNNLTGGIPLEIGHLTRLEYLSFYGNELTGNIPSQIGNLTYLEWLGLGSNQLTGNIPPEIGNLTNLGWLYLALNQLTGSIPSEIGNLSNLKEIWLSGNELVGSIPLDIGNLTNLSWLDLHDNQLTGSIPLEIGNLANLQSLDLRLNILSGHIPAQIGSLINLQYLNLASNELTGVPPEMWTLTNLRELDLFNNDLTGSIPPEIGNLTNLQELWLCGNDLTGSIPPEIGNLTNLQELWLWGNGLTGNIPSEMWTLTNLQELHLSSNELTGNIPPEIGNLTNLLTLDLQANDLTGNIPPEIGNLINLRNLWLIGNQLTGSIPPEIGNLTNLQDLRMGSNNLTGEIPYELGNLSNLQEMYLGYNALLGHVPPEIGNLSNLQYLWLNDNELTGSIPPEIGNLANLQAMELSNNELAGSVPPEIGKLANLWSFWASGNQLTGSIPPEIGDLNNLDGLALNSNQLTGSIPPEIGNLTNLSILDLDSNQLTGNIPTELGNLTNLQHLYLSSNQLEGSIPGELKNLKSLNSFWIRNNSFDFIPPDLSQTLSLFLAESNKLTFESLEPYFDSVISG